jgi:hypothetical protein
MRILPNLEHLSELQSRESPVEGERQAFADSCGVGCRCGKTKCAFYALATAVRAGRRGIAATADSERMDTLSASMYVRTLLLLTGLILGRVA